MDPNILKFLEEDEDDETMYSGADVDALTAQLNRDIQGYSSDKSLLSQRSSRTTNQFVQHWQTSSHQETVSLPSGQNPRSMEQKNQHLLNPKMEYSSSNDLNALTSSQHPKKENGHNAFSLPRRDTAMQMSGKLPILDQKPKTSSARESQMHKLQTLSNQQPTGSNGSLKPKTASVDELFSLIQPQVDQDKRMQLHTLLNKIKRNGVQSKEYSGYLKSIVGEQILKMAIYKLHARNPGSAQAAQNQVQSNHSAAVQQLHVSSDLSSARSGYNILKSHTHGGSGSSYSPSTSINIALPAQLQDSQMRPAHIGSAAQPRSMTDMNIQVGTQTHINSRVALQQNQAHKKIVAPSSITYVNLKPVRPSNEMPSSRIEHANTQIPNVDRKAPPKKPLVGQKKPAEASGPSPPRKKQKVSENDSLDQSIEHIDDVTALSGVNISEEEENLLSDSKVNSRVSEASRRVAQEEESRLILHKLPLQKKVAEIMAKSGLKNKINDVDRCLSLCVEERLRGLISNLIRLSKQRVDIEKPRHRTIITSDIRQQIMKMNREELEKNQVQTVTQNPTDPENDASVDGEKEKVEPRARETKLKANKEDNDKMRTKAANVAVRAATGTGDMLSRWQSMAEAKHKKAVMNSKEGQDARKQDSSLATNNPRCIRRVGRRKQVVPMVVRNISVKDVIALLEREPQMSRSMLLYRLHNKNNNGGT